MVAEAKFSLRAVDETRSAFASVQNNLARLKDQSSIAGRALTKNLDVKDVFRSLAVAIGLSADKIANKVAEIVTGESEEVKKMREELVALGEEGIKAQAKLMSARSTEEQQIDRLVSLQAQLSKAMSRPAETLEDQVSKEKAVVQLYETEIELLRLQEAHRQRMTNLERDRVDAAERLGALQSKLYAGEKVSLDDRILGLQANASRLQKEMANADSSDLQRRIELTNDLSANYQRLIPLLEDQKRLSMDAGEILSRGFEDAVLSGEKLRDVLRGMAQDMIRLIFQNQITKPLAAGLGEILFKGFRADGGPVSANSAYVVGERGPELFIPRASGSIIPNGAGSANAGQLPGSSVNITYNIQSGVSRAELAPLLETERKRLKAEIPDMVRRGGSYRAAFA